MINPFKDRVKGLQERASNALSIFTKTVNDLNSINEECAKEVEKRNEIISKAQTEITELDGVMNSNKKVIEKIKEILE